LFPSSKNTLQTKLRLAIFEAKLKGMAFPNKTWERWHLFSGYRHYFYLGLSIFLYTLLALFCYMYILWWDKKYLT
jgi:hypothetical protein